MIDPESQHRNLEPLLSLEQAARYLNVSKASLRRWTNDGRLRCHRVGARGERRFARADLDAHLAAGSRRPRGRGRDGSVDAVATLADAASQGAIPHVSLYFRDEAELWRLVRPYLLDHLVGRHPIVYICDSIPRPAFRELLAAEGMDPERLEAEGVLRLLVAPEAYLRTGSFTADGMLAFMEHAVVERRAAGHRKIMLSGEMTWYFSGAPGVEAMIDYEARLNDMMARYPGVTTVCSYDLRRFDGQMVVDSLTAHPFAHLPDRFVRGFYD